MKNNRAFAIAALGMEMIFMPVAGIMGGLLVDEKFGWSPWGLLFGLLSGMVVAIRIGMRLYVISQEDEPKKDKKL